MRRITFPLLLCLTLFSLPLAAQDWVGMMRDPHANVHAVQQAFNRWYSQTHKTSKPGTEVHAPNGRESEEDECNELFRRWEWFNVPRAAPNGTRADFNLVGREYHNYLIQHPVQAPHQQGPHNFQPGGTWTYVGNTQVPTNSNTGFGGDGRVNRIRFMPGNSNIMFACAASGGLWKSTNGGSSWSTNTDQLGDLTTSDVAINPLNTNIMYLATGDGDGIQSIYPDPATIGVLKSTDGGLTWNATSLSYTLANAGANYYSINELIIDPSDTAVIIAATTMGIYRTANSGSTWTLAGGTGSGNATWFHSIAFHPGNPNVVYACTSNVINGIGGNFFRSVNNGVSWTNITNGLPSNATAEGMALAVTPADTSLVYVLADRTGTYDYQGLYVSNNDGVSFTMQSGYPTQPNILGNNDAFGPGFGYGQGWYDLTLAVSPTNKDSIMVGGVDTYLSTDGGVTWAQSSDWLANGAPFVHADIHHIEPVPGNSLGFAVACDGGAFITTNGGPNFSDISNNLEIAQQYSIGPSATVAGRWITGWQDNGTNLSTAPWAQVLGGDGMVCFIDWSVPGATTFYAENPNGALQRSTNSGGTWSNITTGITEAGPWVTQWCQDPKTAATLYSGFRNVWKSTNSGGSWTRIGTWGTSSITALAVDSANPAYIYAAQSNMIQYTTNGGASWTNITGTLPVGSANITGIAVKSKSPSHVWVTFSGYSSGNKVFYSSNFGATWTNISTGLPNLPVNCVVSQSNSPNGIYVGTDQGVYYNDTVLNSWMFYNSGLPMVMIGNLAIYEPGQTLLAATYGRGTWETPLYNNSPCTAPTVAIGNTSVKCFGGSTGTASCTATGGTPPYTYSWAPGGQTNATATGLSAATYTVTVSSAGGCSTTAATTITQPASALSAITSSTQTACSGNTGTASVTASGGTPAYGYSWTPGGQTNATATGLSAGSYTVTVTDANSCTATAMASVTVAGGPSVTVSSTGVKCFGGSTGTASSTVTGGTAPYTYTWAPGGQTNATATGLSAGSYTLTVKDMNGCSGTAIATVTQPASALNVSTGTVNVKCFGGLTGSASATVTGGTPAYAYNWTPGGQTNATATGLSAGSYTVTVTDANSCTATAMATITQPASALSAITSSTQTACSGNTGTASVTASGGTPAYGYNWTPGGQTNATATGLSAGSYTVTVTDANSCTATAMASVTVAGGPSVTVSSTGVKCFGGSTGTASSTVTGGTAPYTYTWAPGGQTNATATGLSAGSYTLTVKDKNGCSGTAIATVTQPASALSATTSSTQTACSGNTGTASVTASGGTPAYGYNWTPGGQTNATATGLSAGSYTVTVTDANSCTATAMASVTVAGGPSVTVSSTGVKCFGGSTGTASSTVTGGTAPYTYTWAPGGQTNATATGLSAGSYTLTVKDMNGCSGTAIATVTQPASALNVSTGTVNVKCFGGLTGSASATVTGGTPAYAYNWTPGGQTNATATGLSAGSYTVTVTDANSCTATAMATITQPASALSAITSSTQTACSGNTGTASVTASGGTPAYGYNWTPGGQTNATATGLSAGSYTVTVTDANSCTATAMASVTVAGGPSVTVSSTGVKCFGGSTGTASSTVTGGTAPYTYTWAPGGQTNATATGLSAGSYTLTVKDKNGCSGTAIATVTQPASALSATTSSTQTACSGNTGTASVTASGGTPAYGYNWTPGGQTNATATGLSAGSYTVTVTDANSCTATAMASVTVAGGPSVTVSSTGVKCFGGSTGTASSTVTGGTAPYTYTWAPGGQTNATATGLSAGSYTLTVKDMNGCSGTAIATVTQPASALNVSTGTVNVKCFGGLTGSASATVTGGTPAYAYNWTPGGQTNATATGLSAGSYTVTVTDANSCTATAMATITQPASALSAITSSTQTACSGNTGTASVTASGGTPAYGYSWTPGGQTNATATGLSAGSYTVTVTDANSCTATAMASVTVAGGPSVTVSSTGVKCFGGSTGTASSTVTGGTAPYTYTWAPGGQTNATATGLSAGSYTLTVKDKNGCSGTAIATVTQPASALSATTSSTQTACSGNTGTASVTASGGTPAYGYSWTPGGQTNATATGLSAGSYTVTVTDANSCTATAMASVTVAGGPSVTVSSTGVKCFGGSTGTASSTVTGGTAPYTYTWAPGGQTNATATGLSAGSYTLTVKDKNGCSGTAIATVTQPAKLTAAISASSNITCNGGNNGSAIVTAAGGTGAYTYNWSPSGGTGATASGLTAGTYTATVTDANGCTATASVTLTQPPPMTVTPLAPSICLGDSVVLTANGAATYSWSPAYALSATIGATVTASPSVTTRYIVTGTTGGCVNTDTVLVTVNAKPVVTLVPPSANLCSGDSVVVRAYGAANYTWAPAGGLSNNVGLVVTAFPSTTTTYTVTGFNGGCSSTQTITITVTPTPTVTVNPASPAHVCSGDSVKLTASGATSYSWTPATGLSSISGSVVEAAPAVTTSYTVTGTSGSCTGYAVVVVTVNPTPTVSVTPSSASICSGGAGVGLTASGAVTYTWAPAAGLSGITGSSVTANPSVTTTYTLTGTSGSCSSTQTVTITVNATPTVVVTPSPATICKGDSVTLTASGAGSYIWSPATGLNFISGPVVKASPSITTSYTVTGTNGSCSSIAVVSVNVNPKPNVMVIPPSATICQGAGGVTLSASGAATYAWSPPAGLSSPVGPVVTAAPGTTTTYTVTGTLEGCSDSAVVTVTVDSAVVASISGKDTICAGDSTVLTAAGGGSYSWSTGATTASVTLKPAVSTQYTVTVTKGACSNSAVKLVVIKDCTTGINALSFAGNIDIYPNPTSGNVSVVCNIPEGEYVFSVTDVLGQVLVYEKRHVAGNYAYLLNLSNYSTGMYVLTITGSNSVTQKKIILTK